ncbi:MAG: hypothetical protein ACI8Z1_003598 [Candidatus Azotimanducaceae bacterium]|jgi:hypothetical protein
MTHRIARRLAGRCVMLAALLSLSLSPHAGTASMIDQLNWMVGPWTGSLGPQTVEEDWSAPFHGSMETMIRLTTDEGVQMLELAVIRELEGTLVLHLRQFSPALELSTDQNMRLGEIGEGFVTFVADEGASIPKLAYTLTAPGRMRVEVTIVTGDVVAAELHRP